MNQVPSAPFVFRDVARKAGLFPAIADIRGHGAGWGDVNGDGHVDLYVTTFATGGAKKNMLLTNKGGKFELSNRLTRRYDGPCRRAVPAGT